MFIRTDTSPEAEEKLIALSRVCSPAKKLSLAASFSQQIIALSRRALPRVRPELTEQEIDIAFVELHYGHKLANGVRARLASR